MERIRRIRFDVDPKILRRDASELSTDSETTIGRLRELTTRSEDLYVLPAATTLLSRRDHSRKELIQKLTKRGFSSPAAERATRTLEDRGYQDDRRFAESWLRSVTRRGGRSRGYIAAGLGERGVKREIIEEVISDYEDEHPEAFDGAVLAALTSIVRTVARRPDATLADLTDRQRRSVISRLMRRGFSMKEIQKHFD
jgi:regulatory protein